MTIEPPGSSPEQFVGRQKIVLSENAIVQESFLSSGLSKQARLIFGNPAVQRLDDAVVVRRWILRRLQDLGNIRAESSLRSPRIFAKKFELACDITHPIHSPI
jgi:hypothetical protein